jgi:cytochrome c biogenesis protein CcmG/thiol:disulfide interchange protein DsbE
VNRVLLVLPLVLFVVLGGYFAIGLERDPSRIPSVLIDKPLPAFDLPAIEGFEKGLSSADVKGRVALINIFGSWCASCVIEHPVLMQIAASEEALLLGLDWKDEKGAGTAWLQQHGNPYALVGDDASGRTAIDLGVTGAPETFIVDKKGRIRYKHVGPIDMQTWRERLKPIVEALDQEEADADA